MILYYLSETLTQPSERTQGKCVWYYGRDRCYIGVSSHTLHCNWSKDYRSLNQYFRYEGSHYIRVLLCGKHYYIDVSNRNAKVSYSGTPLMRPPRWAIKSWS